MRRASLLACAGLVLAVAARGEEPPAAAAAASARPTPLAATGARTDHDDGRRTLRRLPANLALGAVGFFHGDNVVPLLVGGMASATASHVDERVAEDIADPGHAFGKSLEDGAAPEWIGVAVAGAFTAGRFSSRPRFRAMSYDLLDAFVVNGAFTTVLKLGVGRERPNGEDDKSFPSGHTSNAFAVAAVAERHYGWKVGVPAYTVAALVGVSRLQRNKHYLSDVVAGATLGYVVGRTVVRVNGRPLDAARRPNLSLGPVVGPRTRGLVATVTF
jgi:membrane-associated phospholipid phosphatase